MLTDRHKKWAARPPQLKSFKEDLKNEVALIEREYLAASTTLPPSKKSELLDAMYHFKSAHADLLGCSAERPSVPEVCVLQQQVVEGQNRGHDQSQKNEPFF